MFKYWKYILNTLKSVSKYIWFGKGNINNNDNNKNNNSNNNNSNDDDDNNIIVIIIIIIIIDTESIVIDVLKMIAFICIDTT